MSELRWPFIAGRDFHISKAEGACLYDAEGNPIIDAAGGAIVVNIGHGRQRVADAVATATRDTSYVVPPWITPSRQALLEALAPWLPEHLTRIHCTSGGTEANEAAMKIALHYQQAIGESSRTRIIGRSISYHGTTLATASISGHPGRKKGLEAALPQFPEVQTPYPLRCPLGSHHADAGAYYADLLRDVIESEGPETIAAFLAEPITGSSGGAIVPPDDYWPRVREICDEYGILLIMDEVMTGFGRTGSEFAYQHWPIQPDLLIGGKGLAGGYAPLGAVFGSEQISHAIENAGYQVMFNTFGGHPAACAAAAEVLNIMVEEELVAQAAARGTYLHERLADAFDDHPHVAEVRGRGLFAAIEVVQNRESLERCPLDAAVTGKIVARGLSKGVFFYGGGTGDVRDIVCMGPPFIISESQLDQVVDTLAGCVDEIMGELLNESP
jgi:adenosylmethionine-8-amino-7-oxononanoate aminotransferase